MNYYEKLKNILIYNDAQRKIMAYYINKNNINAMYKIGEILYEAKKEFRDAVFKEYEKKLSTLFENADSNDLMESYKFYLLFKNNDININYALDYKHYLALINVKEKLELKYYIYVTIANSLSPKSLKKLVEQDKYHQLTDKEKEELLSIKEPDYNVTARVLRINEKTGEEIVENEQVFEDETGIIKNMSECIAFCMINSNV